METSQILSKRKSVDNGAPTPLKRLSSINTTESQIIQLPGLMEAPIRWLSRNDNNTMPPQIIPTDWIRIGPRLKSITETDFCDLDVFHLLMQLKSQLDCHSRGRIKSAAKRINVHETMRSSAYRFGGAVKMQEIDEVTAGMFSSPTVGHLFFADICAGPGGFTEYIMNKTKSNATGIGFTLRKFNDFRYHHPSFTTYYGVKGDGNIYNPENIESLTKFVLEKSNGVHMIMADGGFDVKDKNVQEICSKQMYLCETLVALSILRTGGNFVVKLFDIFTRFSVGLVYLMRQCFKRISIHKPNTSRPANSERYLICEHKLDDTSAVRELLFDINCQMWDHRNVDIDTNELVPLNVLTDDKDFFSYILQSNNQIARNQISALQKMIEALNVAV